MDRSTIISNKKSTESEVVDGERAVEILKHRQLAAAYINRGQYPMAITEYSLALDNFPDDESLYQELSALFIHVRQYNNAILLLESAIKNFPDSSRFYLMLGASHHSLQDVEKAQVCYEKAYELDDGNTDAIVGVASIHYLYKRYDKALDLLEPMLGNHSCPFPAVILYSQLATAKHCQRPAIEKLTHVSDSSLAPLQQSMKYFALGRLNDEISNYEMAFEHYSKANNLMPNNYDRHLYDEYFIAISKCYTRDVIDALKRKAKDSKRLVFIVGMPRSGTSLVEQILASHPDVYGGGELNILGDIIKQLPAKNNLTSGYPGFVSELTEGIIENTAHQYINYIESIDKKSQLVTDKMPDNFLYLGLINILFPQAKIIHCTRNPYDTCLSCYFQQFSGHYPYAYQLDNLAHYYKAYQKLMSYWHDNLTTPIFELNYETLIEDKENVIRKLLEHCQLDWHEDCLEFNKSSRAVTTASTQQVGRALYKTSVDRWRNYESFLDPLISGLSINS